ncbi:bromodomain-containing protein 8 isoform X3 [Pseudophryne corroboree]|uniref:bromodomain-containing protein 8 isoform X3 n=1 Tax=Pseudophryne corroboree TaxID=495146 RepID=UPI0030815D53
MAAGTGKHKLLNVGPTEPWSVREKLCLASSVMRSGDQNWVSVSRAIKPFAEPGRPPDWFSQKHCASQYSELLETTETPKRKRGERGEVVETVEDVIVRKLTAERIEELKKMIKETQEKYRKLKKEAELIQSGHMDSKLDELWNFILTNKKQEEEEAEMKRKATDASYQARQAAKNIPRRTSSTVSRSSIESSSPGGEFGLGDLTPSSIEEGSVGVSVGSLTSTTVSSFIGIPDTPPPPSAPLESLLTPMMDDSPQKKMVGQKATPPPSPLLSELLKKGSLLPSSPRLVSESEMTLTSTQITTSGVLMDVGVLPSLHGGELHPVAGTIPAASESQATIIMMSALPMSAAVPVTQQEDSESSSDPHTVTVSMDSSDISMIIDSINKECLASGDGSSQSKAESSESKGDLDLAEKMDIAVSYTGEELDFETVGDIIAIIEDKVDDHPEVLDVAAVEAALSLCEENDDPQALGGPWDQDVHGHTAKQETLAQSLIPGPKESDTIMNIMELTADIKTEPPETEVEPAPSEASSVSSHSLFQLGPPEETVRGTTVEEPVKEEETEHHLKTEEPHCETSQSETFSNEEEKGMRSEESPVLIDAMKSEPPSSSQNKDSQEEEEEDDDDVTSDVGSPDEPKEEEAGEEYLSEMDNEPPISESDDGYSIHNAQLQSHTLADSIASSPASSQFSVCSEDQEAIQAQKIWKKAIMLVWRAAANHRYANVFLQPVTDDIAPGYHSIVQRPMDLSTIKKNIETGLIRSTAEFQRDIMLMFQNAVMYNSSDHDVYHMAVEMQRDVLEQIQQFLATQLIMQTSESGISAKSLRGRDSTRKQDASEKDSVPMGSPAFLLSLFIKSYFEQNLKTVQTTFPSEILGTNSGQDHFVFKEPGDMQLHNGDILFAGGKSICMAITSAQLNAVNQSICHDLDQDLYEEVIVEQCVDPLQLAKDYSSQLCESVLYPSSHVMQIESEVSICERTENIIPKSPSLLEVLVFHTRESHQDHITIKKMLTSVWKMIATHRGSRRSGDGGVRVRRRRFCHAGGFRVGAVDGFRFAGPFMTPVKDREAPGYKEIVKRPMDLTTIKRGLSKGRITTKAEFQRDIMLMLQNCVMYNSIRHCVHHKALEMQRDVQELLQVLNVQSDKGS